MNWTEYEKGNIHIDHIIPCAIFDLRKEEAQKKCFHYTNLQPLWKADNLKKAAKIDIDIFKKMNVHTELIKEKYKLKCGIN